MTDEVGVVTGELTLRTELAGGAGHARACSTRTPTSGTRSPAAAPRSRTRPTGRRPRDRGRAAEPPRGLNRRGSDPRGCAPADVRRRSPSGGLALVRRADHLGAPRAAEPPTRSPRPSGRHLVPSTSRSSGRSSAHRVGCAHGQRVWKRQPDGGLAGDGRSPASRIRSRAVLDVAGRAPAPPTSAPACTGAAARGTGRRSAPPRPARPGTSRRPRRRCAAPPPGRARSPGRSGRAASCSSSSRLITCAWIDTSSAETGSSATISSGPSTSARAMPMRCRWPPENSCG